MKQKHIIIGLAGEIACGKSAVARYLLEKYDAVQYRFSDILVDILARIHMERNRENFAALSFGLRKYYGQDILAYALAQDIKGDDTAVIVVDGVRREQDLAYLRKLDHFFLFFVDADMRTRYKRLTGRREKNDDQTKTFEEFQKDAQLETEKTIAALKNVADYVIDNNGDIDALHKQIDDIIVSNR